MSDDRFQAILDAMTTGFRDLGERVGQIGQRMDDLGERMGQLDNRIGSVERRIENLDERLERLEHRIEKVEFRLDRIEASAIATRSAIMERIDRLQGSVWEQKQRIDRFVHVSERMEIKVDRVHDDMHDVKDRLTILDTGFSTWAQMVSSQQVRLARFDTRLSLIEKRYELRDGPQPGTDPSH